MHARSLFSLVVPLAGLFSALAPSLAAQQAPAAKPQDLTLDTPVVRSESQLVVVDVTVQDKDGHPIRGLKRGDFTVTESKQAQEIRYFEEHSSQSPVQAGPPLPPMPPGTFTDYDPVPPHGALNVLLLDALNTPMSDQAYVRAQLQHYVKKAAPGTRIAIFGLSQRLFLLQGFSSDPEVLKDAVEHKLLPRASDLLPDAVGSGQSSMSASDMASGMLSALPAGASSSLQSVVSNLQQFEAEQRAFQTQLRIQYTLDAFNTLAHYLSAFPGRKNLIWFSGSFPIDILPDPSIQNGFAVMEDNNAEFRETTNLLSRSQVAVYPVDARGLMVDPTFTAAASTRSTGLKNNQPGRSSMKFYQSQAEEHMTMSQLAEDTGGRAFYNNNDLAAAVETAIESGSNYYTLLYSPSNRDFNGSYREIRVTLNGSLEQAGYRLSYRHGYYTDDRRHPGKNTALVTSTGDSSAPNISTATYARAAMAHGAPTPEDILFKVRVLPVGTAGETSLAAGNHADPVHPIPGPYRRFAVDFAAVGGDIQLTLNPDGRRSGAIEFNVLLYDNDGVLLNTAGKAVELNLTPEAYKRFLASVNAHFEISVPVKGGNDFLRIAVHDLAANHIGVVEVPVASVARLAPLPAPQTRAPAAPPAH